jgi:hypothetical protein
VNEAILAGQKWQSKYRNSLTQLGSFLNSSSTAAQEGRDARYSALRKKLNALAYALGASLTIRGAGGL